MSDHAQPWVIGIIPAAGRATRLPTRQGSKELIDVGGRPIAEYLAEDMIAAGADRLIIVVAPGKDDIVRHFGARRGNVPIEYVWQHEPTGMSDAIDVAYSQLKHATVLMGMPDTVVRPSTSLADIRRELQSSGADVILAVAPTNEPARLGPVVFDAGGCVAQVFDKPESPPHDLVWTVACWSARFTEYLHEHLTRPRPVAEAPLGLIFQSAIDAGFSIRAVPFRDGCYIDAGTVEGLQRARNFVAAAGAP